METINKDDLRTGDILLVSGYQWLSKKIQKFQAKTNCLEYAKYNHADIIWKSYDETVVVGAHKAGIIGMALENYIHPKREYLVLRPKFYIDGSEMGKLINHYLLRNGKGKRSTKYDLFNLLIAQPINIITNGRVWLGELKQNDKKFICGEFVHHIYQLFFPDRFPELSPKFKPCEFLLKQYLFDIYTL